MFFTGNIVQISQSSLNFHPVSRTFHFTCSEFLAHPTSSANIFGCWISFSKLSYSSLHCFLPFNLPGATAH